MSAISIGVVGLFLAVFDFLGVTTRAVTWFKTHRSGYLGLTTIYDRLALGPVAPQSKGRDRKPDLPLDFFYIIGSISGFIFGCVLAIWFPYSAASRIDELIGSVTIVIASTAVGFLIVHVFFFALAILGWAHSIVQPSNRPKYIHPIPWYLAVYPFAAYMFLVTVPNVIMYGLMTLVVISFLSLVAVLLSVPIPNFFGLLGLLIAGASVYLSVAEPTQYPSVRAERLETCDSLQSKAKTTTCECFVDFSLNANMASSKRYFNCVTNEIRASQVAQAVEDINAKCLRREVRLVYLNLPREQQSEFLQETRRQITRLRTCVSE